MKLKEILAIVNLIGLIIKQMFSNAQTNYIICFMCSFIISNALIKDFLMIDAYKFFIHPLRRDKRKFLKKGWDRKL